MKPIFLVITFVLFSSLNFAQESNFSTSQVAANKLYRVRTNYKNGFINAKGEIVIPLQFEYASHFSEGLAAVGFCKETELQDKTCPEREITKFGYIDQTGKIVFY